ncbi:hypothetical protein J6590_012036 [Homalodisca vitripennis]|nr:hypothetical protein J6590_012036 [Homalodisca vitripennis]
MRVAGWKLHGIIVSLLIPTTGRDVLSALSELPTPRYFSSNYRPIDIRSCGIELSLTRTAQESQGLQPSRAAKDEQAPVVESAVILQLQGNRPNIMTPTADTYT